MMATLGLHTGSGGQISKAPSDITLGSGSVSPLTLASAYATVASGGTYCEPSPVLAITTSEHKSIALPKNGCKRVLDPDVANGVTKSPQDRADQWHGLRQQPCQWTSRRRKDRHSRKQGRLYQRELVRRVHPTAIHRGLGRHAN